MVDYKVAMELKSDTYIGSGFSVPGYIDSDTLYDEWGFPYMRGKTFKGKLVEMVDVFIVNISKLNSEYANTLKDIRNKLFGKEGEVRYQGLKFSDLTMPKEVTEYFENEISSEEYNKQDIIDALTHIEMETSIDYETGVAKDNSLRTYRIINRGITLTGTITSQIELSEDEKGLLCCALGLLKHVGGKETKGKGLVQCDLYENGECITEQSVLDIRKKVEING